jgi:hypothetical protein
MSINNDAWKLSNPDDDGHYTEDHTPRIQSCIYYKFISDHRLSNRPVYGMFTTSGHDIKIWNWFGIETIDIEPIGTEVEEIESEIYRIKQNYTGYELIAKDEFLEVFNSVQERINKLVSHEAMY